MKHFTVLLAIITLNPAWVLAQRLDDVDLSSLFSDVHEYPVAEAFETEISGLLRCATYDSRQLVEDPLIPQCWIVTNQSQRHRCNLEGIEEALSVLAFAPSNEEEALTIIRLISTAVFEDYVLADSDLASNSGVPDEIATRITSPVVTQTGDLYTVAYYTIWLNNSWRWHDVATRASLRFRTVEIGPGTLTMSSEQLWSDPPGHSAPTEGTPLEFIDVDSLESLEAIPSGVH